MELGQKQGRGPQRFPLLFEDFAIPGASYLGVGLHVDVLEDGEGERAASRGLVSVEVILDYSPVVSTRGGLMLRMDLYALELPCELLCALKSKKEFLEIPVLRFLNGLLPHCSAKPIFVQVLDPTSLK